VIEMKERGVKYIDRIDLEKSKFFDNKPLNLDRLGNYLTIGINSYCEHGKHILFIDTRAIGFQKLIKKLRRYINNIYIRYKIRLGDAIIVRSSVIGKHSRYHLIFYKNCFNYRTTLKLIKSCLFACEGFRDDYIRKKKECLTLRISPKPKKVTFRDTHVKPVAIFQSKFKLKNTHEKFLYAYFYLINQFSKIREIDVIR